MMILSGTAIWLNMIAETINGTLWQGSYIGGVGGRSPLSSFLVFILFSSLTFAPHPLTAFRKACPLVHQDCCKQDYCTLDCRVTLRLSRLSFLATFPAFFSTEIAEVKDTLKVKNKQINKLMI